MPFGEGVSVYEKIESVLEMIENESDQDTKDCFIVELCRFQEQAADAERAERQRKYDEGMKKPPEQPAA